MRARYRAGKPRPRSQSLAKTMALESNSQAGEKLLQAPPVSKVARDPSVGCSHTCFDPPRWTVKASHLPSGDGAGPGVSPAASAELTPTVPVEGSRSHQVEAPCSTNSNWTGPSGDCAT